MEPIPVDLMSLRDALDDNSMMWYLDLRSGDLVPVSHDPGMNEFVDMDEIRDNPEIFLKVESRPSREGFAMMEGFVDDLPEGESKRSLARALRLPRPFRTFKDTLYDFPEEEKAWFAFRTACLHKAAIRFLEVNSVPWTSKYPQHDPPA